jgi:hypothetical protein
MGRLTGQVNPRPAMESAALRACLRKNQNELVSL